MFKRGGLNMNNKQDDANINKSINTPIVGPAMGIMPPQNHKSSLVSNLTKIQKVIFLVMLTLILALVASTYYFMSRNAQSNSSEILSPPVSISKLSCNESQETLTAIYSNPELTQTYKNYPIESVSDNILKVKNNNGRVLVFTLTSETKYEKIGVNINQTASITEGKKDDLKKGMVIQTLQVNPLKEVKYVSYSAQ